MHIYNSLLAMRVPGWALGLVQSYREAALIPYTVNDVTVLVAVVSNDLDKTDPKHCVNELRNALGMYPLGRSQH